MIPSESKLLLRDTDCNSFLTPSVSLKMTFLNALLRKRASEASWIQTETIYKHSTEQKSYIVCDESIQKKQTRNLYDVNLTNILT